MRYLILSFSLLCGCGTADVSRQVIRTGAEDFVTAHRLMPEQAKKRFTGRLVQIYLPPGTHSLSGSVVCYKTGFGDVPPVILFDCREQHEKGDPGEAILVTGLYVGLVRDGIRRGGGIDWCVTLTDCSVTRLSTRP